jgi:hypothetical protein
VAPAFFESVDSSAVSGDDGGNGGFGVLPEGGSFIPSFSDAGLGAIGNSGNGPVMPTGPTTDFPAPIFDGTAPMNSDTLFGAPGQGAMSGGPCLVEPEGDVLYPQNWLRPRFRWTAANGANLFELRLHVDNQLQDLVVYTTNKSWTMPRPMWDALRTHSPTVPMKLSIRGGALAGTTLQAEAMGTQTSMGIAPVQATGAIVYWTTNDVTTNSSVLKGFSPGDEAVQTVLTPPQFAQQQTANSQCIGCHTSTPDGEFAAFTTTTIPNDLTKWSGGLALIDPKAGQVGSAPPFMGAAGAQALARWNAGGLSFSPAHWKTGDRRAIASFDNNNNASNIVLSWIDLEATDPLLASGTVARNGDTQSAGAPNWSHDGNTVAYVSTNRVCTGRLGNCRGGEYNAHVDMGSRADIFTVPYAGGQGGTATGLPGASDPLLQEYYPAFSPDDHWIAFDRIANDLNLYEQSNAELFVIPSAGGTAKRLPANDPPQCAALTSPGLGNVWPKWGPTALQGADGSTYYWLIFDSTRIDAKTQQLYMTGIVQRSDGSLEPHGAVYLWNQPPTERNHTPAWDTFKVPPQPPPR